MPRPDLPTGTVTFLFTDVEGSTKLLHELGAEAYADALATHRRILRDAFTSHGGVEVDTQGDALFVAFPTAPGALAAAIQATDALADGPIHVRMGLHTGTPLLTDEGYIGPDVHKGARIGAAGHGGQILVSSATAQLIDGADLHDLGLHRLKDLTAPERIFQVGDDQHRPLKTLHQTNLPIPATPFLGRDAELAELDALFGDPTNRLITLTGPGGTGKTRLALQAAADAADRFAGGIWWVPLAALRDPELVLSTITSALGASGDLVEHIGDKHLLLLLDNIEHLIDAADDVAHLLAACPHLVLLITSREPLHVAGEQEYAVEPLRPDEAVELFLTRAAAVRRDFAGNGEVALICARLDHLPLAVELAAARVKVLSPRALLDRLEQRLPLLAGGARDLPARQRTLHATIEWSHELLTADEQRLFARLAVFRGGWDLETAEQVVEADLDTLQSLVDKSLVRVRDTGRFWMLETIREFAVERLESSGEFLELRARAADHFAALALEAESYIRTDSHEWVDRLERDHDNLRATLDHLESQTDALPLQRMVGALWRFWYLHSHFAEGRRRIEGALDRLVGPTPARLKLLHGASVMTQQLGDHTSGVRFAEEARALAGTLGDKWGVAYATMMIGNSLSEAHDAMRDLASARDRLREAAALFEALGDRHYALIARHNQAWIIEDLGDAEEGRRLHEECLVVAREIGHEGIEANALAQLGMIARDEDRFEDAVELLRSSIRIDVRNGMHHDIATQLGRLSSVLVRRGDAATAATLLGASNAMQAQLGAKLPWWAAERNADSVARIRAALGDQATERLLAEGAALDAEDAVAIALGDTPSSS